MKLVRPHYGFERRWTIAFLAVWATLALAWWVWLASPIIPRPVAVVRTLPNLWFHEGLGAELYTSLTVNVHALLLSLCLSLGLAYATVLPAMRPLTGAVATLRFLGLTGLTLIFTLATGGGHALKVLTMAFGMTVFFVTAMWDEVASVTTADYDQARTLRMGEWRSVFEVVILGKADAAMDILRQNAAIGWMLLTSVEALVRSEGGIGTLLLNANKHFRLDDVFAILLVILAVGVLQDRILVWVKGQLCPHAALEVRR